MGDHAKLEVVGEGLVCSHLSKVTSEETAWVLLQEPGFIGFGVVHSEFIRWPPDTRIDWTRVTDIRLFGEIGEWHVWSHWDATWRNRILVCKDVRDTLTEYHVLWGSKVLDAPDTPTGRWVVLAEDRGTNIWLPLPLRTSDLPLRLKIEQLVEYDGTTGMAGIVDAAVRALVSGSDEKIDKLWKPPNLP